MQLSELCNEILKRRDFYKQTLADETTHRIFQEHRINTIQMQN